MYDAIEGLPDITAVAYLDDLQLIGTPTSVLAAFDRLSQSIRRLGLTINASKCQCLWPHSSSDMRHPHPPSLLADLTARNIQFRVGFAEVLGGPIGFDANLIQQWCLRQVKAHDVFFTRLHHSEMDAHHALLLLKVSLRPRINFLMRCAPPSLMRTALTYFDSQIKQCLANKVMSNPDLYSSDVLADNSFSARQMRLPNRKGGLGLSDLFLSSNTAYFASCLLSLADVHDLLSTAPPDHSSLSQTSAPLDIQNDDNTSPQPFINPLYTSTFQHILSSSAVLQNATAVFPRITHIASSYLTLLMIYLALRTWTPTSLICSMSS